MVQEFMELANVEPNLTQTPIKECKELCFLDYQCYARNASLWYPSKCYPWHHWDRWNALG